MIPPLRGPHAALSAPWVLQLPCAVSWPVFVFTGVEPGKLGLVVADSLNLRVQLSLELCHLYD